MTASPAQTSLFGDEQAEGPRLTDRQRFALERMLRHREGLTTDELGALLHERKGVHADWQRCQWCSKDGLGVLRALRKKELVVRRRSGQWQLTKVGRGVVDLDERALPSNSVSAASSTTPPLVSAPAGNGDSDGDPEAAGSREQFRPGVNTPSGEVPVRPSQQDYDPATAAWPAGF